MRVLPRNRSLPQTRAPRQYSSQLHLQPQQANSLLTIIKAHQNCVGADNQPGVTDIERRYYTLRDLQFDV